MDSNHVALDRQRFPALAASFRAKALGLWGEVDRLRRESRQPPLPAPDPERPHAEVERLTARFRAELARKHRAKTRDARGMMRALQSMWCPIAEGDRATPREDRDLLAVPPSAENPNLLDFSSLVITGDGEVLEGPKATRAWVDLMWEASRKARWHEGRDRGQQKRFDTVRSCGSRLIIPHCTMCEKDHTPIPEGCGVARLCAKCSLQKAKARRARFGRGRARMLVRGARVGLTKHKRQNGRFSEKMLTLTVPHVMRVECKGAVLEAARDDVHARILAAYLAWPIFLRKLNYHLSGEREERRAEALALEAERVGRETRGGARRLARAKKLLRAAGQRRSDRPYAGYHRAFEWTPGKDGLGHPHFHVYLWSTFLPAEKLHAWWASSLRKVGLTIGKVRVNKTTRRMCAGTWIDNVVTELRQLGDFNAQAVYELMKGGKRSALELSRLTFERGSRVVAPVGLSGAVYRRGPGLDAYDYAEGWTIADVEEMCSPDVRARLYMALEARRLSQASRGFFEEDPPCACVHCGATAFLARFESVDAHRALPEACSLQESRGPP